MLAALAVQKILREERILEKAAMRAEHLTKRLNDTLLGHPNIGEIRHIGLINAIELVTDKQAKTAFDAELRMGYQIFKYALENGLILRPLGNVLYFNPPLTINEAELDEAVALCAEAIAEILGS